MASFHRKSIPTVIFYMWASLSRSENLIEKLRRLGYHETSGELRTKGEYRVSAIVPDDGYLSA